MSNYRMSAQLYCREHPDAILIDDYHAGDMVCPECGLVVGDRVIDVRAEWRTFSYENDVHDKDNSRVGAAENLLLEDNDMSTMIATGSGSKSMKDEFGRALYRNRRTFTSSQKALRTAYQEVADMADRLNRPQILVDRTIMLFKQVYNFRTLKARSSDAIVAACLYIVCRQDGVSQTFKEICAVSKESKREIGRVYKLIIENLKISMDMVTPGEYMSRFCNNLRVSKVIQNAATYIAEKAVEMDLVHGWSSASLAATAIYMASQASDEKKTAHEIGDITGVQPYTIKRVYESIRPKAMVLFPEDFQFSTPVENLPN